MRNEGSIDNTLAANPDLREALIAPGHGITLALAFNGAWEASLQYKVHVNWHLGRFSGDLAHKTGHQKPRKSSKHPANQLPGVGVIHVKVVRASDPIKYMKIIGYNTLIAQRFA